MRTVRIILIMAAVATALTAGAQQVSPKAYYTDSKGMQQESDVISDGQAPLDVTFRANPSDMGEYSPSFEWHFVKTEKNGERRELFVRYEEDTQYTFNESGNYDVVLKTRLEQDGAELDSVTVKVSIAESRLEMPNAFSPNDDGFNDVYGAKGVNDPESPMHYRSIVKFDAYIFNRYGQKIYEWHDPAGSWNGKHNGHDVKEGVYYVLVKARGADGKEYNIRKDVNLIRGYNKEGNGTANE